MSAAQAMDWLALALVLGVVTAAVAAATARSLFVMVLALIAAAAMAACALLAHGMGDAALGLALLLGGVAPFLLLALLLLSARTAKPLRSRPWLAILAAIAAAGAILFALPDLGAPHPTPSELIPPLAPNAIAAWTAPLVFVGALACFALLGFGERGVFERSREP